MGRRSLLGLAVLVLLLQPAGPGAFAASLSGAVVDGVGAPVAGVHVVLVPHERTRPILLAMTRKNGQWSRDGLVAGVYRLIVSKLGYATAVRPEVEVEEGPASELEVTLTPIKIASREGTRDLTWLIRGLSGDVLRWSEDERPALPRRPGFLRGLPLSGRVALTTTMGGEAVESVQGQSAGLMLRGETGSNLHWFLDGRRGAHEVSADGLEDALERNRIRYGLSLAQGVGGQWHFEGELNRAVRSVSDAEGSRLEDREQLVSYALGWSRSAEEGGLAGVELAYRAAQSGLDDRTDTHELLVTRGAYARSIGDSHHVDTRVELTAQSFTSPNGMVYLHGRSEDAGMLADPLVWLPASWTLRAEGEHRWEMPGRLTLMPGLGLFRSHHNVLPALLQPRLGMKLMLDQNTAVGSEISYAFRAAAASGTQSSLGYGVELERRIGQIARVSVAARLNAPRGLDEDEAELQGFGPPDFLILTGEGSSSRELALGLEARMGELLLGRMRAVFGEADGSMMFVPVGERVLDRQRRALVSEPIQYVVTAVGTTVQPTETDLDFSYRWADGLLAASSPGGEAGYARLDVRVRQPLPWIAPLAARVELLLNLRSYLARPLLLAAAESNGWYESSPAQHTVTGGVAISF